MLALDLSVGLVDAVRLGVVEAAFSSAGCNFVVDPFTWKLTDFFFIGWDRPFVCFFKAHIPAWTRCVVGILTSSHLLNWTNVFFSLLTWLFLLLALSCVLSSGAWPLFSHWKASSSNPSSTSSSLSTVRKARRLQHSHRFSTLTLIERNSFNVLWALNCLSQSLLQLVPSVRLTRERNAGKDTAEFASPLICRFFSMRVFLEWKIPASSL